MSTTQFLLNDGEYIKIFYSIYKEETARYMIIRKYLPSREPDEIQEFGFGLPKDRRIVLFRYGNDLYYLIEFLTEFWLVYNNERYIEQVMNDIFIAIGNAVSSLFKHHDYDYTEDDDDSVAFVGFANDDVYDGEYEVVASFNGKQYNIGVSVVLDGYVEESDTPRIKVIVDSDAFMWLLREAIEAKFKLKEEIYVRD